jgi:hypothetical protein
VGRLVWALARVICRTGCPSEGKIPEGHLAFGVGAGRDGAVTGTSGIPVR